MTTTVPRVQRDARLRWVPIERMRVSPVAQREKFSQARIDAIADGGFDAAVIDGMGHLCQRYNGDLNDPEAITRLANMNGGVNGLLSAAERIKLKTGKAKGQCVAAAAVEVINRGKGGRKLPSWWKDDPA